MRTSLVNKKAICHFLNDALNNKASRHTMILSKARVIHQLKHQNSSKCLLITYERRHLEIKSKLKVP